MTLLDIKNHLYAYFLNESSFSLKNDLNKIKLGGVYDEALDKGGKLTNRKEPLFRAALEEMEKGGLLLALDREEGLFILHKPLNSFVQNVAISPGAANLIADIINELAYLVGHKGYVANKLALTEGDIVGVAQIGLVFREMVDDLGGMENGSDGDNEAPDVGLN